MNDQAPITDLLSDWSRGNRAAGERLIASIYPRLRAIAAARLPAGDRLITLEPTEVVHEAFLKLGQQRVEHWKSRAHFFKLTARIMRRIVADNARHHLRGKRGGDLQRKTFDSNLDLPAAGFADWARLDRLLGELERIDARAARVTELRAFAGLTVEEVSSALDISPRSVARSWRFARAWLERRVG